MLLPMMKNKRRVGKKTHFCKTSYGYFHITHSTTRTTLRLQNENNNTILRKPCIEFVHIQLITPFTN